MVRLPPIRFLGLDPGLRFTGWGVIDVDGNRLRHIGDGVIATDSEQSVPERLKTLHDALMALLERLRPDEAAVEETYVNRNGAATLKLGYARGVALLAPALAGVAVTAVCRRVGEESRRWHRRRRQGSGGDDGTPPVPGVDSPGRRRRRARRRHLPRAPSGVPLIWADRVARTT